MSVLTTKKCQLFLGRDKENLKNMKTTEKTFDSVKYMRQQRDKLSEKLSKMTKEEILEYFKNRKSQLTIKPCA